MSTKGKSTILLVGSGGVGTMATYALETGGQAAVTAVCRSNYDAVKTAGFNIDSLDHGQGITGFRPTHVLNHVPNVQEEGSQPFDFLVVTTKNIPDVRPTVLDIIEPAVTSRVTTIVLLQNGLNIEKPIVERFPNNVVLSGVSLIGATEFKPGHIRHDDRDRGKLGQFPGQRVSPTVAESKGRQFVELYTACGKVDWQYDEDVNATRWRKLVYNSCYNSVSAILGMDTARMRMSQFVIDDLVKPAMLEIVTIAKAAGVHLPSTVVQDIITVDPTDTAFVPSMGQDAAKGNYVEHENIVGEPLREAERLDVPAPTLRIIYGFLKGIQLKAKESKGLWEPKFAPGNPYV